MRRGDIRYEPGAVELTWGFVFERRTTCGNPWILTSDALYRRTIPVVVSDPVA